MHSRRHATSFVALMVGALVVALAGTSPASGVSAGLNQVVSANPADTTPHVLNGTVRAIAEVGGIVYVGGTFTTVKNAPSTAPQQTRRYLFAFNPTAPAGSQIVSTFNPQLDGVVESIAPAPAGSGGAIIVGGRFRTVGGTAQRSLAMLTTTGARVTGFNARTNGTVDKVLVRGNRVLAGGNFGTAGGSGGNVARVDLADFNLSGSTAALGNLNLPVTEGRILNNGNQTSPSVQEMDANSAGTRLVVIGNFRRVGGQLRQQIAMIDLTNNTVAPWSTNRYPNDRPGTPMDFPCADSFHTNLRDVEISPDGNWFVVVTTGAAVRNSLCDTAARWEMNAAPNANPTWINCTGGDTLWSVAVTNAAVYVGGHQRWHNNCDGRDSAGPGAVERSGIAALSPTIGSNNFTSVPGSVLSWNPGKERGVGVEELVATSRGLYVGSDTRLIGTPREVRPRLAFFPANG